MDPTSEDDFCLVLSGGGAKGVYHLGVWRALKELGVPVGALVGTSVGALMAAFLAQGGEAVLESVVRTLALDSLFELPPELVENGELRWDRSTLPALKDFARTLVEKRGLDTGPLRRLVAEHLDEAAVRASGKDLGFVTINLTDLEPREVFLEDIEPGRLVDYLMASAAFPGFEQPVIDGKRYLDGGLYDNTPFTMARARGYRRIIVSDISGPGRTRRTELEGGLTVYIRASIKKGGVLDLDPGFLEEFQTLGYLDTLRAWGRLDGSLYFVDPDPDAEAAAGALPPLPPRWARRRHRLLAVLECAGLALDLPRIQRHTYASLKAALRLRRDEEESRVAEVLSGPGGRRGLAALVRREAASGVLEGTPYRLWRLGEELLPGRAGGVLRRTLVGLYPELPAALAWLRS